MSDRDEYRQTAATPPVQVEERESPRFHDFGAFVLSPSSRGYAYGGSMGLGLAMSLVAAADGNRILFVLALGLAFAGGLGMMVMREQLREFNQPAAHWTRKETPVTTEANERPFVR